MRRPKAGESPTLIYYNRLTDLLVRLLICYIPVKFILSSTWRCFLPNDFPSVHSALPKLLLYYIIIFFTRERDFVPCKFPVTWHSQAGRTRDESHSQPETATSCESLCQIL